MSSTEESLVKPKRLKGLERKKVVYFPMDSCTNILRKKLKGKAAKEINLGYGQIFILKDKFVLYQSVGASAAVLSLEGLIASGAEEIIMLGFCGSLNREYPMKSVVSISRTLSEEGTSRHYFPHKRYFKPSLPLKKNIEKILHSHQLPFLEGSLVSTDAPYRETKTWLEQKQRKGIDLVDMEASSVFSLAEFRNIQAAALMIVSDEIYHEEWKHVFSDPGLDEKIKKYFLPFV
jgi:purine-nucleoside phosphorylase